MIYALVWFHFIHSDHLQYYLLDQYPNKETCEIERDKAQGFSYLKQHDFRVR